MEKSIQFVTVHGPESTGKTTLALALADAFTLPWIAEEARNHIVKGQSFTEKDILRLAKLQYEAEKRAIESQESGLILADTNLVNFAVWLFWENFTVPTWLIRAIKTQPYRYNLLLQVDVPWVNDGFRNISDQSLRDKWFTLYAQTLDQYSLQYEVINGDYTSRENMAKSLLKDWLKNSCPSS
ncbi:MAG: ATP-binding protein [Bacteroidota bacterium]|nr:ATP-binding protein [Bacteroidota bacterium]